MESINDVKQGIIVHEKILLLNIAITRTCVGVAVIRRWPSDRRHHSTLRRIFDSEVFVYLLLIEQSQV